RGKGLQGVGGGDQSIGQPDTRQIARVLTRARDGGRERGIPGPEADGLAAPGDLERERGAPAPCSDDRYGGRASAHAADARSPSFGSVPDRRRLTWAG